MAIHQIQVRGRFAGTDGGWRPAVTGTLNQTGRSDAEASTFEDDIPDDVIDLVCNELADDQSNDYRVVTL